MGGRGSSSGLDMHEWKNPYGDEFTPMLGERDITFDDDEAIAVSNPNYKTQQYRWTHNCQRCVYAYEMLRRGFNVEAKERESRDDDYARYLWRHIMEGQKWDNVGSRSKDKTIRNMDAKAAEWGEGARGVVYIAWKGGRTAHVFNVERRGGQTIYVDAQTGKYVNIQDYVSRSMPTKMEMSRIDHLKPSKYTGDYVKRRN